MMNVTQIKKEEDLDMQSPPGFARKASNGQGTGTGANDHGNKGNKEADIIRKGDEQAGRSNRITEEVAEDDDDHCEQEVVDPDFYGFNKSEDCIAVGQIWAIISDFDGNPRFYAKIKKVYSPFKVDVTWLVFVAGDLDEVAWKRSGVPVACGKFKHGLTVTIENMRSFSHMMLKEKGSENSYIIYPRKGETWALRKNWNITWSSDPDNHNREYEYEFVVVLSAYTKKAGILVANLVKLEGFVCVFKPTKSNGIMDSFQIPSNEMMRFSHRVPSFLTNGNEQNDVPQRCCILDPCSLPSNHEEMSETVDGNIDGSVKSVSKEKHPIPKKRKCPDAASSLDGSSPGGFKSSRMSNGCCKNPNEEKNAAKASGLLLDKSKVTSASDGENNVAAQAKEMSPDGVITIPSNVDEDIPSSSCCLKIPDTKFCNFDEEQSCEKFKTGQIWALYCKLDKFPRNYAQIESVESFPVFKIAVKWLKSCDPPRGIIPWVDSEMPVSCGTFKVTSSEAVVFNSSICFSHQLSEVPAIDNVFTIYPRVGEVWALFSKFCSDLTCSDLKKCEYDMLKF